MAEIATFVWDRLGRANAASQYHDDVIMSDMIAYHASKNYQAKTWSHQRVRNLNEIMKDDIARTWAAKNSENSGSSDFLV